MPVVVEEEPTERVPVVYMLSPLLEGERVVPVLDQYPKTPEVGGVEVRFLEASVYTAAEAVSPERLMVPEEAIPVAVTEPPELT
jgi:hypothetical protein